MKMTFDEFLVFLEENLPHIFNTIELVIIALLNRRVGKVAKAQAASVQHVVESEPIKEVPSEAFSVQKNAKKLYFEKLKAEMLADLDLIASDVPDEELSDEQQKRIQKVISYIQGG